jgi:hypothetical protein
VKLLFRLTSWFVHVLLQLNTKDILFICGGAFVNLDRLVAERTSTASLGFGNPVGSPLTTHGWLTSQAAKASSPLAHTMLPIAMGGIWCHNCQMGVTTVIQRCRNSVRQQS